MKKQYTAPDILFEDFSLSESIAAGCERVIDNIAKGQCALIGTGNIAIFTDTVGMCEYTPGSFGQPEDTWDGFCYHVPVETSNLFNS